MNPVIGDTDTICAIATPPGIGGVSIIRVSGPGAISIVRKIAGFLPVSPQSHQVYYGFLKRSDDSVIDEVLVSFFKHGKSFTGEDVCEISCHGSPVICEEVLKALISGGARSAGRGEFTYRAFMHGRLDLVQAEAVLGLINSQSKKASEISLGQLKGGVSEEVIGLEDTIVWLLAHFEAQIDFSTENLDVIDFDVAGVRLKNSMNVLDRLVTSYKKGKALVEGFSVCFLGMPNVGKSSLLNVVLGESRAIVTDIAGTTRDVVDGRLYIEGALVRVVDTAGIRPSEDKVETLGIERSFSEAKKADLVFVVVDAGELASLSIAKDIDFSDSRICLLINKSDLLGSSSAEAFDQMEFLDKVKSELACKFFIGDDSVKELLEARSLFVSSFDRKSRDVILEFMRTQLSLSDLGNEAVISQARHFELLTKSLEACDRALRLIEGKESPEIICLDLREALIWVQQMLGKSYDDEVLDRVFKEFCIGK